jgi:CHAT domain-containing protein
LGTDDELQGKIFMSEINATIEQWLQRLLDREVNEAVAYLQATGRANLADAHLLTEAALTTAETNLTAARRLVAVAVALSANLGDPPSLLAHLAYARARIAVFVGDLGDAERFLHDAQTGWQSAGDNAGVTRSRLGLTQVLAMQGRLQEAEETAQSAIAGFEQNGLSDEGRLRLAGAHHNLATLYVVQDRYEPALIEYARAADILIGLLNTGASPEMDNAVRMEQAHNLLNRATALTFLDRPAEAEATLNEAIAGFTALGDYVDRGRARTNLGRLLLRTGRAAAALTEFDAASLDMFGETLATVTDPERLRAADELLLERAVAHLALNLLPEARHALTICDALFRSAGQQLELAQTLYMAGLVELRSGNLAEAPPPLKEALSIFTALDNVFWRNRCVVALAVLDVERGHFADAAQNLDKLLADALTPAEGVLVWDAHAYIDARLLRSRVALEMGEMQRAESEIAACERLLQMTTDDAPETALYPQHVVRVLHAKGRLAHRQGQFPEAVAALTTAVTILERQRLELPLEEIRSAFLDDKSAALSDLLLAILDTPHADEETLAHAFDAMERARSRSLLERLATSLEKQADPTSAFWSIDHEQLIEARRRVHWLYNRLLGDSGARHLASTLTQTLHTEEALLNELLLQGSPSLDEAHPVRLAEFQAHLRADVQALFYSAAGDELLAFVVDRTSIKIVRRVCSVADTVRAQRDLRFQMGRASLGEDYLARNQARLTRGVQSALKRLYDLLFAPVAELMREEELLIAPTGPLHLLPFHALWDGEHYLLERHVIRVTPSASMAVRGSGQGRHPVRAAAWAGLALPDRNIPAARQEVERAAARFTNARIYVDEGATLAALHESAHADILHIAAHGLYRSDNPFFSVLKLADGWADVRAIYRLPLAARLVVLSACESGVGQVRGGDEVIGLVRGFLGAGAASVIASLWNVHDASALRLMDDFYAELTQNDHATPAQALRRAQMMAIDNKEHPYFWAPFFVTGG